MVLVYAGKRLRKKGSGSGADDGRYMPLRTRVLDERLERHRGVSRDWVLLHALAEYVRVRGFWPSAPELLRWFGKEWAGCGNRGVWRVLHRLLDDPLPLVALDRGGYRGGSRWSITERGWKWIGKRPIAPKYSRRPKLLAPIERRRKKTLERVAVATVYESLGEELPILD